MLEGYDDRCSAFRSPENNFIYQQIFKNVVFFLVNLSMSLAYVLIIAAAVPIHLKYLAKICFSSLIFSAFTPCLLDFPAMALEIRKMLPAAISPALEMAWVFVIPFLYELVVGAFFAAVLPIVAKAVLKAVATFRSSGLRTWIAGALTRFLSRCCKCRDAAPPAAAAAAEINGNSTTSKSCQNLDAIELKVPKGSYSLDRDAPWLGA